MIAALALLTALSCSPSLVCTDTTSSLHGVLILEGITLSWSTDDEVNGVASYRIYRNSCPEDPSSCQTLVATIGAASSCGNNHEYTYTDHPDAPLDQWFYTVEVWGSLTRFCSVDVDPE